MRLSPVQDRGQEPVAHQPNEYTIIDNTVGDAKVFARHRRSSCGAESPISFTIFPEPPGFIKEHRSR